MTKLIPQERFLSQGHVSVWLGNFSSEIDFDEYCSDRFELDFGFKFRSCDSYGEYNVSEDGPKPIQSLFDKCYQVGRYLDAGIALCQSQGWNEATTLFLLHWTKYDPSGLDVNLNAPLKFIGAIEMKSTEI